MQLFKKLAHVKAGDPITADLFNAIAERLEAFSTLKSGSRYVRIWDTPYGKSIALALPQTTWALLSGSTSPYSWTEVRDGPGGTWVSMPNGDSGTSNCYEVNGRAALGGKVVPIEWTSVGDWRFQWVGFGCTIVFRLRGCNSCPVIGANVDFVLGGTTVFSGVTNSFGDITFTGAAPGNYTIDWSVSGTGYSGSEPVALSSSCSTTIVTKTVTPTGTDVCTTNCAMPVPAFPTLFVTDDLGTRQIEECIMSNIPNPALPPTAYRTSLIASGTCGSPLWTVVIRWTSLADGASCPQLVVSRSSSSVRPASCSRPILITGTYGSTASGGTGLEGTPFTIHE